MAESGIKKVVEALRLPGETLKAFMVEWSKLTEQEKAELKALVS